MQGSGLGLRGLRHRSSGNGMFRFGLLDGFSSFEFCGLEVFESLRFIECSVELVELVLNFGALGSNRNGIDGLGIGART